MSTDPFATMTDEPTQAPATTVTTITKENPITTTDTQSKIVATLKGGSGYDAPWIVVHANDAGDAVETLKDPAMKELLELTQNVGEKFVEMGPTKPARSNGGGNRGGKPAGAAQAPNGQEPPEGYVFKSGMSKAGKPWKAFMPADRNSGLQPIWL